MATFIQAEMMREIIYTYWCHHHPEILETIEEITSTIAQHPTLSTQCPAQDLMKALVRNTFQTAYAQAEERLDRQIHEVLPPHPRIIAEEPLGSPANPIVIVENVSTASKKVRKLRKRRSA